MDVIALFAGVIGFISFLPNNLPKNPTVMDSSVRIAVALNGDEGTPGALRHAAGPAPLVQAFNENQNLCGSSKDSGYPDITSGSFVDLTVWQWDLGPGEQATTLQIIPTTNELCIAYISQTWADGTHRGWLGDMGKGCDRAWYYSNVIVGEDHKPTCTWIDHDHSHDITTAALQIHMQDFTNLSTTTTDNDPAYYCQHPTMLFAAQAKGYRWKHHHFHTPKKAKLWDASASDDTAADAAEGQNLENDGVDDDPENEVPYHRSMSKGRRIRRSSSSSSIQRRRSGLAGFPHLIASKHDGHSARELCGSQHSHGPDFFSRSEGVFCDMESKTPWTLCHSVGDNNATVEVGNGDGDAGGCYHWETHSLVVGARRLRGVIVGLWSGSEMREDGEKRGGMWCYDWGRERSSQGE